MRIYAIAKYPIVVPETNENWNEVLCFLLMKYWNLIKSDAQLKMNIKNTCHCIFCWYFIIRIVDAMMLLNIILYSIT